jgi:23S rRNA pseudouridine2605 synthase
LITAGRVTVNGEVVTELGFKTDPENSTIRVDGRELRKQRSRYLLLNKPRGYITTMKDERDRWKVMDLIHVPERVFPVGRLDRDTEGLLLLTNDGDVANRVMHPRYGLDKEYHVLTLTRPRETVLQRVRDGVTVEGRTVVPSEFRILRESQEGLILKIVIHEGAYHIVRRMMETVGIPVERLRRVRVGPLNLTGIALGESRDLTSGELTTLLEALGLDREIDELTGEPIRTPTYQPPPRSSAPTKPQRRPFGQRDRPAGRSSDATPLPGSSQAPRREQQAGDARSDENRPPRRPTDQRGRPLNRREENRSSTEPRFPSDRRGRHESQREENRPSHGPRTPTDQRGRRPNQRDENGMPTDPKRPSDQRGRPVKQREESRPANGPRKPSDQRGRRVNQQEQQGPAKPPRRDNDAPSRSGRVRREDGPSRSDSSKGRDEHKGRPQRKSTGSKPPKGDRDRRSGGGGQEHGRSRTRRPSRRDLP